MEIDVKISVNKELLENPTEFKATNIAAGWVEVAGAFKFPVQVLKNRENKMFVKFPTKKNTDDTYSNVVFPIDKEVKTQIEEKVIAEVHNEMNKSFNRPEITEVNVSLLPDAKPVGSIIVRAMASIVTCGIKINGFAVKESGNGYFVQMPQYRDEHGQYHDQFYGTNKVFKIEISNSILEAYENKLKEVELANKQVDMEKQVSTTKTNKQFENKGPKL